MIEGQPGVFAAGQRTDGFTATNHEAGNFEVAASVPANGAVRPLRRGIHDPAAASRPDRVLCQQRRHGLGG